MIQVGQTIGNYKITAKLGEGGMGVVYLAEHPVIGRKVAMKAIHPELSRNPEVVSRFMTEAKSVNQIGNEHIVDISDFGNTADGEFYFVMEFLQGEALADRLKRERLLKPRRALDIAGQVADALAASHRHGIIHRDLKPENIFLISRGSSTDFVKVLDFGLAKLTQGEEKVTHKTRTGSVMGTPFYMAPEQCEGKANIDQRADVYSLGVILFEMLTGAVPFSGEGYGEIIVKHITQPPPSARGLNPALSAALETLLMRALAKPRAERFQSMEELKAAIEDPERHATRAALALSGTMMSMPGTLADASNSARMSLGQAPASGAYGALPVSMSMSTAGGPASGAAPRLPSVFEHAGAISPEDLSQRRQPSSKTGLVAGAVVVAVAAAAGLFFVTRGGDPPATAPAVVAPAAAPPTPPAPPPAEMVTLTIESTPSGAKIWRNGEEIGVTPKELSAPKGEPVAVVLKMDGYDDEPVNATADGTKIVRGTLVARKATPPVAADKPEPRAEGPKPKRRGTGKPKRGPTEPEPATAADPDGVLAPKL